MKIFNNPFVLVQLLKFEMRKKKDSSFINVSNSTRNKLLDGDQMIIDKILKNL